MATAKRFICILLLTSLVALATAKDDEDNAPEHLAADAAVQGVVMCQSCTKKGTWSLEGATALPGAKVGVSCKDYKHRVSFYNAFETDDKGYFYAPLNGLKLTDHHMDGPIHACKVHLISSKDPNCNLLTNINRGIGGSHLRFVTKRAAGTDHEVDLYSAGPLAFRPTKCSHH